jgi:hypothetical protein
MLKFKAEIIEIIRTEDNILVVGFAKDSSYQTFVTLQHQDLISSQDMALGMTKYYIEIGAPVHKGSYNAIKEIDLTRNRLLITFNALGQKEFSFVGVEITIAPEEYKKILSELTRIFENEKSIIFKATNN